MPERKEEIKEMWDYYNENPEDMEIEMYENGVSWSDFI